MRNSEELVEFIREKAKIKGTSLTKIEKEVGLSNGRIGKWKTQKKYPPHDILLKIANIIEVSIEELTGEKENPAPILGGGISEHDVRILEWFHSLPEEKRRAILEIADGPKE